MSEGLKATSVEDVALPVELVTLTSRALRQQDGSPLVVRCEFIEEMTILAIAQGLPGGVPELGPKKKAQGGVDTARNLLRYAPGVIEAGCALARKDGTWLRPAFYFGADPGTGALPGRFLSDADKLRLFGVCMRLSGYAGGAAASVNFRGRKRGGRARSK